MGYNGAASSAGRPSGSKNHLVPVKAFVSAMRVDMHQHIGVEFRQRLDFAPTVLIFCINTAIAGGAFPAL